MQSSATSEARADDAVPARDAPDTQECRVVRYVYTVVVACGLAAVGSALIWPPVVRYGNPAVTLVVAAVLLIASETRVLYASGHRDTVVFTAGGPILCVMLGLISPPLFVVLAAVVRTGSYLTRPQSALKGLFNVAKDISAAVAGSAVAWGLGSGSRLGSVRQLAACALGFLVYELLGSLLVSRAVALASGRRNHQPFRERFTLIGLSAAGDASTALMAMVLLGEGRHPALLVLLALPLAAVGVARRRFSTGEQRAATAAAVSDLGRELNHILDLEAVVVVLAERCRELLRAESVSVFLHNDDGWTASKVGTAGERPMVMSPIGPEDRQPDSPLVAVEGSGESQLRRGSSRGSASERHLAEMGVRDLVIAPFGRGRGAIQATNRLGTESFDAGDLLLLNLVADVASGPLGFAEAYALEKASGQRLRDLDRLKRDFIASVSHELRTPLTLIHGFTIALQGHRTMDAAQVDEFLAKVRRNSVRLGELIERLLATSLLDDAPGEAEGTLDLAETARSVLAEMHERGLARNVDLDLTEETPRVCATFDRVDLILRNLVENALKYSEGLVTVRVRSEAGCSILEVVDRGPGIPVEQQETVFDRFYQIDQTSTRKVGGTGLGLYLVRQLSEAIDARVELESAPGEGCTFSVVFARQALPVPVAEGSVD